MDSADISHSSHYGAGVTRRIFGYVSLNCDDVIYSCSRRLPPASYSLGKPGVTPGHYGFLARREPRAIGLSGDGHPAQ